MSVITVFLILLAVVFAIVAFFTEPSAADKRIHERLTAVSRRPLEEAEEGIERQVTFSTIPLIDRMLRRSNTAQKLVLMLEQAHVTWTVGRFFLYTILMVITGALLGNMWIPVGLIGWLPGMLLGLVPLCWVLYRRSVRLHKFNLMLPQAVDLMSRGLQAGYSLPNALVMVAEELDDPVGPEFRRTAEEINFGLPFREALLNLAARFPVDDLHFLVTAILVQKETGGNMVVLLEKLAVVLRARVQLKQKVRVFTAQGRLSGAILVALPFVLFIALNLLRPGYSKPMLENETGQHIIYGTLAAIGLGVLVIRRIINIRV